MRDAVTVKQRLANELEALGQPDLTDPTEPHALLARYPIKLFLTTNYDPFMTQALLHENKAPVTGICPWYRDADIDNDQEAMAQLPASYAPSVERLLVFHLHGATTWPRSMVLMDSDYIEFLARMTREWESPRMIPRQVLGTLGRNPVLFLGYQLRDSTVRVMLESQYLTMRRRHVMVQLAPRPDPDGRARQYLESYYDGMNISVYWGTTKEFCAELDERLWA